MHGINSYLRSSNCLGIASYFLTLGSGCGSFFLGAGLASPSEVSGSNKYWYRFESMVSFS